MYNKRKYRKYESKYEKDALIVRGIISRIEKQNLTVGDKVKTVFYCPSKLRNAEQMFVIWGRTTFNVGDELEMKGRFLNNCFLVWSHKIIKRNNAQTPSPLAGEGRGEGLNDS